jgi:hypothetical protein
MKTSSRIILILSLAVLAFFCGKTERQFSSPERTILFISDAMPVGAPERVPLEQMLSLKEEG